MKQKMMETKKPCKDNEASHSIKNVDFRGARNIVYSIIVQRLLYMVLYRSEYCTCLKIRFFGVLDYCT